VTGLTAVPTAAGTITLYWFAPEDNGGWPITHYLVQARRDGTGGSWLAVPDDDELSMVSATAEVGGVADDSPSDNANMLLTATTTVAQASITATAVDHDNDVDTTAEQVRWHFRVYAVTTDDGPDDDAANAADNVLRRSTRSSETSYAKAAARPSLDPLATPSVTATGDGGSSDTDAIDEEIELTINLGTGVTDQPAYRIDYRDDEGEPWKLLEPDTGDTRFGADRPYEDAKDLGYDQRRDYRVFAIRNHWRNDVGPPTAAIQGNTDASEAPGRVTGVMASSPSTVEVNASWSAPEDDGGQPVANYRYRYVKDDGDDRVDANNGDFTADTDTSLVTASTESGDLMHTIEVAATSALEAGELYHIQIAAQNQTTATNDTLRPADGSEVWSETASFVAGGATGAPMAVEGLTSQVAVDTSGDVAGVLLLWNKPSAGAVATSYVIERMDDGEWVSPTTDAAASPVSSTSYTDPKEPEADEMRQYRVFAAIGESKSDPVMVYYPRDPAAHMDHMLGDASGLTAVNNGDGTVTLSWTPGPNSNIHWVAAARRDGSGFNTGAGSTVWEKADMAASHTVDVSNLHAGTYAFTVIAGQYDEATGTENWDSAWTSFADAAAP
jgi:hypothetical protein